MENFNAKDYTIETMSFDEWTRIFLKSTLLQNYYHNKFNEEIENLEVGKEYEVIMEYGTEKAIGIISYNKTLKRFNGKLK